MVKEEGKFIVLDGLDGSGKSTQTLLLKEFFERQGKKVVILHEPNGKTKTGRLLKKIVKDENKKITKEKWISLFNGQRKENLVIVKKEISLGKIVILDRYYYSTLAYQLDQGEWKNYVKKFLRPDITIILDLHLKIAMKRIYQKNKEQRLKKAVFENAAFLKDVKKKFLNMKNLLPCNSNIFTALLSLKIKL